MVRSVDFEKDFKTIQSWYDGQGWGCLLPISVFPDNGYMVDGLACAWLYLTDSCVGWVAWHVINPDANTGKAFMALGDILDHIKVASKEFGVELLHSTVRDSSLKNLCTSKGFELSDDKLCGYWSEV